MTDINLLHEVKKMSEKIRGDRDSGNAYLLGYLWATLTPKQQKETALAFADEIIEKLVKEKEELLA